MSETPDPIMVGVEEEVVVLNRKLAEIQNSIQRLISLYNRKIKQLEKPEFKKPPETEINNKEEKKDK